MEENGRGRILTCVYCGHEYPAGTPASGLDVSALTDHIRVCEKHPMREAEQKITMLRRALAGLIGVDGKEELEQMELLLRATQAPTADKASAIDAIHALIATLPNE